MTTPLADAPVLLPPPLLLELEVAYATPPRAYHNFSHVLDVLRHHADVSAELGWQHPAETYLAVLYHDAVYEAGRRDNEARSAERATEAITRWMPQAGIDTQRVAELICLTARHGSLRADHIDNDAALFLDCDMAILGAAPEEFDRYDRGIADENRGKVPGWLFRINRRRFLRGLLKKERIFLSDFFHSRYDAAARDNLRRTLGLRARRERTQSR
jgi:predicted metal-dependent HD superfamily phosphohydrolase